MTPTHREMWEIAENLFRVDLSKEQRDEHIRRYDELIEQAEAENPVVQNEPLEIGYGKPPPRPKGIAKKIAEQTGLSKSTVQRAINNTRPAPAPQDVDADSHHCDEGFDSRARHAALAEKERALISQRTKDALAAAKAKGVVLGRHGRDVWHLRTENPPSGALWPFLAPFGRSSMPGSRYGQLQPN